MKFRSIFTKNIEKKIEKGKYDENWPNLEYLGEFYHDFSIFRVKNRQLKGHFEINQQCKSPIINAYVALAIAKSKKNIHDNVTFAELFCADGYYAMVAALFGAAKAYGIDNNKDGYLETAKKMSEALNLKNVEFINCDIAKSSFFGVASADIVANIGGLYHVENPEEVLVKSYKLAKKFLIIQSVVSLANDDPAYFEIPAPGWTWGSRHNKRSFHAMIKRLGYTIRDCHFNELAGNERPEDRGSVYYLIEK